MPKHLTTNDTPDFITAEQIGANNGVAQLGADGKVPDAQLPAAQTGAVNSVNGQIGNVVLTADAVSAIPVSAKGAINGVPQLDSTGRMPGTQLPANVLTTATVGQPSGLATLGSDGKLTTAQVPTAPVTSVAGKTGVVTLTSTDVGAIPTTQKGANNGVASLDGSGDVPLAQIPSLLSLYQPVPGSTPTKPGQRLTAIAGGSNSTQWTEPLTYTASSSGAMPTGVPTGSLCVRTDQVSLYQYTGSAWVVTVPYETPWSYLTLPSGTRGYSNNDDGWRPRVRKIGNQVFMKGRIEMTNGSIFVSGWSLTLASQYFPLTALDITGTCTTASGQIGTARFQLNESGVFMYYAGSGPNPSTPWLGWNFSYHTD